uniref:Uncharacterized protein n=1 Tax=Avena sativa TaxID=4498 RepID=A0ACD5WWB7_AVESA
MDDDVAPCTALAYLDPSYWDQRFEKEEHYEWLKDFSHFRHLLTPLLSPSISVLEVGCGNSRLGEEILREGVSGGVTCIDLSPVAVHRMHDRLVEQGTSGVDVVVADMLDMPFESDSFDLVIEKGTMDALCVDIGDPWNPNPTTVDNVMKMLEATLPSTIFRGPWVYMVCRVEHIWHRLPLFLLHPPEGNEVTRVQSSPRYVTCSSKH